MNLEQGIAHAVEEKTEEVSVPDIDLGSIRRLAHRRTRRRTAVAALALTAVVGGVAVQVSGVGFQDRDATPLAASRAWPLEELDDDAPVAPGRYAARFSGDDLEPGPVADLDVPPGFRSVDGFYLYSPEGGRSLGLWIVGSVNRNPCYSVDFAEPGPSVRALADALVAQPLLRGTEPTPVRLAGFDGLSLQQSVPAGLDWRDCLTWAGSPRRSTTAPPPKPMFYFATWRDPGVGVNWNYAPGQTHRVWILDVNGHRLVVDAAYDRDATAEQVRELTGMVESIRFRQPE